MQIHSKYNTLMHDQHLLEKIGWIMGEVHFMSKFYIKCEL